MALQRPPDTYRHQGMRKQMVRMIREKGITNQQVLTAMETVPRHFFFNSTFIEYAYEDKPFPIGAGQTISQPFTVAFQSQLMNIQRNEKALEIGTGSGYQACILAELGARVFTIERQKSLYDRTSKFLQLIGYPTIKTFFGDGYLGLPAFSPFDKIIVTAAAPYIPEALLSQLKTGGILLIRVGPDDTQIMTTIFRKGENEFEKKEYGAFRFVPMLEDKVREK